MTTEAPVQPQDTRRRNHVAEDGSLHKHLDVALTVSKDPGTRQKGCTQILVLPLHISRAQSGKLCPQHIFVHAMS